MRSLVYGPVAGILFVQQAGPEKIIDFSLIFIYVMVCT